MRPADRLRILAMTISDAINLLAALALPDQFGPFPVDGWETLRSALAYVQAEPAGGAPWSVELHLDEFLPGLLEAVAEAPVSADGRAPAVTLATRFLQQLPVPVVPSH